VKFRLVNIGPIKDAEIELGDFTLFLGLPSTGKSFALRSIYSSLTMLDSIFLEDLRRRILNTNAGAIGIDYITAYFDYLLALGFSICDKEFVDSVVGVVNSFGYNVKSLFSPTQDGCLITLAEEINPVPKISEIINEAGKTVAQSVIEKLKNLIEYEKDSSIFIDNEEMKSVIERIKPHFKIKQFEQITRLYPTMPLSEGQRDIVVTINNKGLVKFEVNFYVQTTRKVISKITEEEIKAAFTPRSPSFHRPFIFEILDIDNTFPIDILKKLLLTEYSSVTFIPYGRSQLILSYNNLQKQINQAFLQAISNISPYLSSLLQTPEWLNTSYIYHFASGLEKLVNRKRLNDENIYISEIMDNILDLVRLKVEVIRLTPNITQLYYKMEEKRIEPSYASAMVNEVASIFVPLLDLETPTLVLIEEPESQLHLAYQNLLLIALLSLVQHGYNFVISTHSDLIASFLGDLVRYKPSKEKIAELLKKILNQSSLPHTIEKIIEEAEKTIKGSKIKVYYFENGTAREVPVRELTYDVPGITKQVIDSIVDWEAELIGDE